MKSCKFCSKFSEPFVPSHEKYDTVIFETKNFVVTPTMGSLVEGWLLIISKSHFICSGQLQDVILLELEILVEEVTRSLQDIHKKVFVFEHGPSSPAQTTGCGIDHLHIHVVPLAFDLWEKAKAYSALSWDSADFFSRKELYQKGSSYLYLECPLGEKYIASDLNIPSQFFRRVIAKELNIDKHFDWKENFGMKNVDRTIHLLTDQSLLV